MDGPKRPRWLIIAVLLGLAVMAIVSLRSRPTPVAAPVASLPTAAPIGPPTAAPIGQSIALPPTSAPIGPPAPAQPSTPRSAGAIPAPVAPNLTSTSGPNDWAMEGYNPARTRAIAGNVALPLVRQQDLSVVGDDGDGSPLTIAHGVLLVESPHQLRAFDLRSGMQRWSLPLDGIYLSPAVAGDTVFVRSESDNQGQLLALDIASGKQRWAFRPKRLSSRSNSYFGGHLTSPVVVEGTVFVGAGKEVYALDATSGALRWEFAAEDYITSSATVAAGQVYISDFKNLYAIDGRNGAQVWAFPVAVSIYFSPVVADQTVLLANGDQLVALDTANGEPRWVVRLKGEGLIPGAVQGSRAFVKSTSTLFALDLASGKELWRTHDLNYISLPVVAGDKVFVVRGMGADTAITALDAATGRDAWKHAVASLATTPPVIAGQSLYVRTTDGRVLGFGR